MRGAIRGVRSGLLALAVAGALAFGATQAFARTTECTVATAWGTCYSQLQCESLCNKYRTTEGGVCDLGTSCCYCIS